MPKLELLLQLHGHFWESRSDQNVCMDYIWNEYFIVVKVDFGCFLFKMYIMGELHSYNGFLYKRSFQKGLPLEMSLFVSFV